MEELQQRVAALKHDLAKYVAWRSANLDEAAWSGTPGDDLLDALRADVLRTREGPAGTEAAWEVWERLTADLPTPLPAQLQRVEAAVGVLKAAADALQTGDREALAGQCQQIRAAQATIRSELKDLHRELMRAMSGQS